MNTSAIETFESLLDFMLNQHIITLLNTYAYEVRIYIKREMVLTTRVTNDR
jgi:hypothetical protein